MKLICGLGNKDKRYFFTRHNLGYLVLDHFAERLKISFEKKIESCKIAEKGDLFLAKPLTYMNLSGELIGRLLKRFSLSPDNLILVHDDMDMAFGRIKIKWNGGDGGHKGVRSVIDALGSTEFLRLKIGVGRDPKVAPEIFLLSPFEEKEREELKQILDRAADALEAILNFGKEKAMSLFNRV